MAESNVAAQNPVTVAAAVAGFGGALLGWGLDVVVWPPQVEATGYVLGIAVLAAVIGRFTQRKFTDPKGTS